jgi:hypothetical protein
MKVSGIMSGKIFKGSNPTQDGVTCGPNTHKLPKHPINDLLDQTNGDSKKWFEPNGQVIVPPEKIEYLKS